MPGEHVTHLITGRNYSFSPSHVFDFRFFLLFEQVQETENREPSEEELQPKSECCPYHCLWHEYTQEEQDILRVYKHWKEDIIKSKLRAVEDDHEEENRDTLDLQGEILKSYVEEIRKNKILRRATFWQNVMQVVVFFVFVFNALFTGFGLIRVNQ